MTNTQKTTPPSNSLKFERRGADRTPALGSAVAAYTDNAGRNGIAHVELIDQSYGGLGVFSSVLVEPGMTMVLCPDKKSMTRMAGTVVRCEAIEDGYRLGLAFNEERIAA